MLRRNSQKEKQIPTIGPRKEKIKGQVISIKHPCLGVLFFFPSDWLSWKYSGTPLQFSFKDWKLSIYDKISLNNRWSLGYDKIKRIKRAHIKEESVTAYPRGPQKADFKATASQEQYLTHTSFVSNFFFGLKSSSVTILRFIRTIKLTKISKPGTLIRAGATTKRMHYLTINSLLWECKQLL